VSLIVVERVTTSQRDRVSANAPRAANADDLDQRRQAIGLAGHDPHPFIFFIHPHFGQNRSAVGQPAPITCTSRFRMPLFDRL
jgi:hypothetical protein